MSNKDKIEGLKKIYKNPIKIVKLKIDNTIDYEVSPIVIEKFMMEILQDK